jgi:hypothetical protein
MLDIHHVFGRLVCIRAVSPLEPADVEHFREVMRGLPMLTPVPLVVCADVSRMHVLPAPLASELVEIMQRDNTCVARSGFLLSPLSASLELQFDRLLSEAGNGTRRVFFDRGKLLAWLAASLDAAELAALHQFLDAPKLAA